MIIGSKLLFYKDLPSTNTTAASLIKKDNLQEGTIVYTNHQSAGRGYSGNSWHSDDSKNLLISLILYPSFIKPKDEFIISMTISLGICDFLLRFVPGCAIKWPNDIYVKNDKIAGILIDGALAGNKIEYVIAGIGFNINQEKFPESLRNPVSLRMLTGKSHDLDGCLGLLASDLDKRYKQLIAGDSEVIKREYLSKIYRRNAWGEFRDSNGIYTGKILTVHDDGQIVIERQDGTQSKYYFKETEFIL
jgi:BirA family biotin operon repressor/biotin-[acetyl-CoA-carboxylase] ligase